MYDVADVFVVSIRYISVPCTEREMAKVNKSITGKFLDMCTSDSFGRGR